MKSGNDNRPNRVWLGPDAEKTACYIARFVGLQNESEIGPIGKALPTVFRFEDDRCRFRYMIFAADPNQHYAKKGVSYITFDEAISFIVQVRGHCWIQSNIGVASTHHQWDELLVDIFAIANKTTESEGQRVQEIRSMLATRR